MALRIALLLDARLLSILLLVLFAWSAITISLIGVVTLVAAFSLALITAVLSLLVAAPGLLIAMLAAAAQDTA
jgi:hypothetical protein